MTSHSQLAGQQLTEKDLLNVMEELADVRAKWYNIGLGLGVSVGTLDGIHAEHSNTSDCLRETLKKWLNSYPPHPTWSKVVEALRTKIVDKTRLATDLECKYCSAQDTSTAAATPSPQSTVPITPPHHPTQDTSTAAATLSPQSTVPITPPYHPTQDTSTAAAATLSPQSIVPITPPCHPTQDTSTAAATQPTIPTTPPHHSVPAVPPSQVPTWVTPLPQSTAVVPLSWSPVFASPYPGPPQPHPSHPPTWSVPYYHPPPTSYPVSTPSLPPPTSYPVSTPFFPPPPSGPASIAVPPSTHPASSELPQIIPDHTSVVPAQPTIRQLPLSDTVQTMGVPQYLVQPTIAAGM